LQVKKWYGIGITDYLSTLLLFFCKTNMDCLTKNGYIKKYSCIIISIWIFVVAGSLFWNISIAKKQKEELALQSARSIFNLIVATRSWNASQGSVYAPTNEFSPPNPYLDPHLRDIQVNDTLTLTKINPAYMTRLISEVAARDHGFQFRITSLKPIRPGNKANEWETKALKSFEAGKTEYGYFVKNDSELSYYYMAPLFTSEECLQCHKKQGYELGDIRGGISIIIPSVSQSANWPLVLSHIIAALAGITLLSFFTQQIAAANDKMELLASRDSLTGVANRRFFQQYLGREWLRAKRNGSSLSFLMCDIDFFKLYNDTYGHQAGDNCLSQVAEALASGLKRPGDFIARYGGEEFAIILPETSLHGAESLAGKILKRVEELKLEHLPSSASKYVTVSIGVTNNETLSSAKEIIAHADKALYQAKKEGKNKVICVSHEAKFRPEETTAD
jgi:diguanylate cyclase (GGDEF)-like protein